MIESDSVPLDLWLRVLVQLRLPIAAIYSSGGKSVHALYRVDAETKAAWDQTAGEVKRRLVPVGACAGTFTAVRLTRLPGCFRGEKGRMQKLLYLNPEPEQKPIMKLDTHNILGLDAEANIAGESGEREHELQKREPASLWAPARRRPE